MTAEEKREVLRVLGDLPEEVYDELVAEMLAQARAAVPQMREAFGRGDYASLKPLCHSIKGTAANLRRKAVAEAAADLEKSALDAAQAAAIPGKIDAFERLLSEG